MPELRDEIETEELIKHLTKALEVSYGLFFVNCAQSGIDPLAVDMDTFELPEDSESNMFTIHFRNLVSGIKSMRTSLAQLQAE
jgi:hypothetical protein